MSIDVATLEGGPVKLSDEALQELAAQLRGPTVWPSAPPAEPAPAGGRPAFNAMHPGSPAVRVECYGTADVVDAVRFARDRGLAVAVRGGGHSIAGLSSIDGGMLIDLAPMRGVQVDPEQRIVRVQGGALWGDVDRETQAFGLVAPGGVVSDTGVGGLTLGGGYGWVRRKCGLSCDNVLEAQIVLADGQVVTASPESHPDLHWAIRGGGGNYGVVTSFTYRLHPVGPEVAFAGVFYPLEDAARVVRAWASFIADAPDELTTECVALTVPPDIGLPEVLHGRPVLAVAGVFAGDPDDGMRAIEPLARFATPLLDISQPMPYAAVQTSFDLLLPRARFRAYWKSMYLDELTEEAIEAIVQKAHERPTPRTLVTLWQMGGAIARVDPEATAFAERSAAVMMSADGIWDDAEDDARVIGWVRSTLRDLARFGNGSVYLNFTGLADEAPQTSVDDAFGRNLQRLARVKATYDPENFFRRNNNITPAR